MLASKNVLQEKKKGTPVSEHHGLKEAGQVSVITLWKKVHNDKNRQSYIAPTISYSTFKYIPSTLVEKLVKFEQDLHLRNLADGSVLMLISWYVWAAIYQNPRDWVTDKQ